jgi:hypothetical protein
MSLDFRTKNALLLAKLEATAGTEESPVPGSDAIRIRDSIGYSPSFQNFEEGYVQESVSQASPIIGGGGVAMRLPCWMTGATAPGTAGPDWAAVLLRACAFSETKTAAPVTGTSQAIAAGTITLAAGASAVDNAYRGMPIDGTSGSVNGQRRWMTAYNGTTKVAAIFPDWVGASGTPTYSIPANALYIPVTLSQKSVTIFGYQHDSVAANTSRLRKLKGGMGNGSIAIQPGGPAGIDFNFAGQLPAAPTDVSRPAAGTFVGSRPEPYLNAVTNLGNTAVKFNDFSLDFGNRVVAYNDPAQAYGQDTSEVTFRSMAGRITPCLTHISSRDSFSDWLAGNQKALVLAWGSATGKKIALLLPAVQFTGNEPGDVNGYQTEGVPFRATGLDVELFLSIS